MIFSGRTGNSLQRGYDLQGIALLIAIFGMLFMNLTNVMHTQPHSNIFTSDRFIAFMKNSKKRE
jgi:hypothetical protein